MGLAFWIVAVSFAAFGFLIRHGIACNAERSLNSGIDELKGYLGHSEGETSAYKLSCGLERQRADANYEEVKRLRVELAEANRTIGFLRRALDQKPE